MKAYFMGILCAAFLCSLICAIGGSGQQLRRLICGVFLALAVFRPPGDLDLPRLSAEAFLSEAEAAVAEGTAQADAAQKEIIIRSLEAYILTRAEALGLRLRVQLTVHDNGTPAEVILCADASPTERETLIRTLSRDLGIGREDIIWTDPYQSSE